MAGDNEAVELVKSGPPETPKSTLTIQGMKITFKDLQYSVPSNVDKKTKAILLKKVSGYFLPRQMAALMGPSGSGKTTLLDVLAGRKTTGEITGDIHFAAHKPTLTFLRRYTGYVEQFDTMLDILTVQEMLMYTAELKRNIKEKLDVKKQKVEDIIKKLALEVCRDTKIGNAMHRGISGGQAKRVNIGMALVTSPRVLFLDEPTSGLDSYTSNEVMTVVKQLVSDGITICATIHSPTPYAFSLFDRLIMLVRGEVVYFGDRGAANSYFEAIAPEFVGTTMSSGNEAEWLTDVIVKADRTNQGPVLAQKFGKSPLKKEGDKFLETFMQEHSSIPEATMKELEVKRATVTPFWWALKTLVKYRTTRNYQSAEFLGPRIGDKLIFSLILMSLYWGIGDDLDADNFINISACLFMWCTLPAFGAASYVPAIVLERQLFIRERNDGLYRVITYMCAKIVDELLIALVASGVFGAVVFFPVELQGSFALFWFIYFATLSCGIVLAYFVAALSPNMDVANAALPTYVVTLLFFAGFLFRFDDIPDYWFWYSKINFLKYAWGSQMANQWGNGDVNCTEDPDNAACIVTVGNGTRVTVLQFYGLEDVDKWNYGGIEVCFFVGFFFLAYLALAYMKHSAR